MKPPVAIAVDPRVIVEFDVRDPESINRKYGRGKLVAGVKALFTTARAKAFERRVAEAGWLALVFEPKWPKDVWRVAGVTISYQYFDCNFDVDASLKMVRDSLEKIAYENDRVCDVGALPPPIKDGSGRRIRVRLELHHVFDAATAREIQIDRAKSRLRASKKRPAKSKKPRFIA